MCQRLRPKTRLILVETRRYDLLLILHNNQLLYPFTVSFKYERNGITKNGLSLAAVVYFVSLCWLQLVTVCFVVVYLRELCKTSNWPPLYIPDNILMLTYPLRREKEKARNYLLLYPSLPPNPAAAAI